MRMMDEEPSLIIEVQVGSPSEPGAIGAGTRRFIPITGGRISGFIQGDIIPGGGDWQTVHDDGNLRLEAHYACRTSSGAIVEVVSRGVRAGAPEVLKRLAAGEAVNPREYYFRTAISFLTGSPGLTYMNYRLYVARGERRRDNVRLEVFDIL